MGLLDSLFGKGHARGNQLARARANVFEIYKIGAPTPSQQFHCAYSLCVAGFAILNAVKGNSGRDQMDSLLDVTHDLIKPLRLPAGELSLADTDRKAIMETFSPQLGVSESTLLDGTAAFDAAMSGLGRDHMEYVLEKSKGPFGFPASVALFVGEFTFGAGSSKEHFLELTQVSAEFVRALLDN